MQDSQRRGGVESLDALAPVERFVVEFATVLRRVVLNASFRDAVVILEKLLQDEQQHAALPRVVDGEQLREGGQGRKEMTLPFTFGVDHQFQH